MTYRQQAAPPCLSYQSSWSSCAMLFASVSVSMYPAAMEQSAVFVLVLLLSLDVSAQSLEEGQKVKATTTLAGVLKEYLDDIETVELAVSKCASGHRGRHQGAAAALGAALARCVGRERGGDSLVTCVEDQTRRVVSDVRQHITALKNCVDTS